MIPSPAISTFSATMNTSAGTPHALQDADSIDWVSPYNKPLIMSEFGGDALYGYHGDASTRWTEEYQENLYQHQLAMLKRISFLRGMTPWVLDGFSQPATNAPWF